MTGIEWFQLLAGHARPFLWQEGLYNDLVQGRCPPAIDIPTGLGKTSVMQLWLLALAEQARRGLYEISLPRRLIWVVDRRVVVDQATQEAETLRQRLNETALQELRRPLASLSVSGEPLAISTLRGEHADNRSWFEDPTRPAIIVGTVDMIGSRLLFSGYGVGSKERSRQAGFLAFDALVVNDEAHLTPVFAKLMDEVCEEIRSGRATRPHLRFVRLSATQRSTAEAETFPGCLDGDVASSAAFRRRYEAVKQLEIEPARDSRTIERLAIESKGRTIVFVRKPKDARKLAGAIRKKHGCDVPLITGEQRGLERDELIETAAFKQFTEAAPRDRECWLVATSAGEAGINLSCDRLITELDTADHLLQRFGRLNRFGETEGVATVVVGKKHSERELATLDYLKQLDGDVSPRALRERPPTSDALSPEPRRAPLQPWLIDVWSMTSLRETDWPSRPPVAPWLRGDDDQGPPETYVCWRRDVTDLASETVSDGDREEAFRWFPVLARERLKQYPDALCEALDKHVDKNLRVLLIGRERSVTVLAAGDLVARRNRAQLYYATLVLPPGVGSLDANGAVEWSESRRAGEPGWDRFDVSEAKEGDGRRRKYGPGEPDPADDGLVLRHEVRLASDVEGEEQSSWRYYTERKPRPKGWIQGLTQHQELVRQRAREIVERLLGPEDRLNEVLCWAAERHDLGKACEVWQRYACNDNGSEPLAKSERFRSPSVLAGYRHELGSLLDPQCADCEGLTEQELELALHLIASHHGRARPCFPESAMDKRQVRCSREQALEAARRFARLQRRYGAWGLAYLEALFCAADAMASTESPEDPDHA